MRQSVTATGRAPEQADVACGFGDGAGGAVAGGEFDGAAGAVGAECEALLDAADADDGGVGAGGDDGVCADLVVVLAPDPAA